MSRWCWLAATTCWPPQTWRVHCLLPSSDPRSLYIINFGRYHACHHQIKPSEEEARSGIITGMRDAKQMPCITMTKYERMIVDVPISVATQFVCIVQSTPQSGMSKEWKVDVVALTCMHVLYIPCECTSLHQWIRCDSRGRHGDDEHHREQHRSRCIARHHCQCCCVCRNNIQIQGENRKKGINNRIIYLIKWTAIKMEIILVMMNGCK